MSIFGSLQKLQKHFNKLTGFNSTPQRNKLFITESSDSSHYIWIMLQQRSLLNFFRSATRLANVMSKSTQQLILNAAPVQTSFLSLLYSDTNLYEVKTSFINRFSTTARDPTARRPNKVCDPYGQNGKPLSNSDASKFLPTIEKGWTLVKPLDRNSSPKGSIAQQKQKQEQELQHPIALEKEFYHADYMDASRFASIVAAVAHNNNHYPKICLERRLMKREKAWAVVTTVSCRTETLKGLSSHDFHIAMLIDVEAERDEVQRFLLDGEDSLKKHI